MNTLSGPVFHLGLTFCIFKTPPLFQEIIENACILRFCIFQQFLQYFFSTQNTLAFEPHTADVLVCSDGARHYIFI